MITTTTPSIEGKRIQEYKGIVFGEVVAGVDVIKDFTAGISNFFGGRSSTYEGELIQARQNALREMEERAREIGANAVVGVDIDYEVLGSNNGMLMVTASGTAVGPNPARCDTMQSLKRTIERCRRIISVFQRNIPHRFIGILQIKSGSVQSSVTDIF